jgi:hypothetical protein
LVREGKVLMWLEEVVFKIRKPSGMAEPLVLLAVLRSLGLRKI